MNNEGDKIYASSCFGIEIEDPYLAIYRMKRRTALMLHEENMNSEFPSWMTLEGYLTIKEFERKRDKISFFKRLINLFK